MEKELVSGLMYGVYTSNLWQGKKESVDFYLLKGIVEGLLNKLNIKNYRIEKSTHLLASMHPGIHADLYINDEFSGYLGKLHPELENQESINKTYVFELELDKLVDNNFTEIEMQEIPKFPSVNRDLALILDKDIPVSELLKEVKIAGKKQLVNVEVFDLYLGENIGLDKKSIALSLEFMSKENTLEASEVDTAINRILNHLETKLNAKLR